MSVLSFPRIHVKGLLEINVGTANNDDYSGVIYNGNPLRLADSVEVQPLTYGMSDEEFIEWIQKTGTFDQPTESSATLELKRAESHLDEPERVHYIPAEWNYYGDMCLGMIDVRVLNVQYQPQNEETKSLDELIGAELSFKDSGRSRFSRAILIDVNPEDVPSSQIFADFLALRKDNNLFLNAKPSKAVTRWINFQRNTGLKGPNGAAAYFYCVVPREALDGQPMLELMDKNKDSKSRLKGIVFRYYIYRPLQEINVFKYPATKANDPWFRRIEALYKEKGINPDISEFIGTISPWYEEEMMSAPNGRILNPTSNTISLPKGSISNGPNFRLAPAVLAVNLEQKVVSVDFSGTFPDSYSNPDYDPKQTGNNPKFDFGQVNLLVQDDDQHFDFGEVNYQDTKAGDLKGWVFDFPITESIPADLMQNGNFVLRHETIGNLLEETEYQIVSDQSCIFAEQRIGSITHFTNENGQDVSATIRVFRKGKELDSKESPSITVWEYDTTPNQAPGPRNKIHVGFKPGDKLSVIVTQPGNRFYTFTLQGEADPPEKYSDLDVMTIPQINLRILPNEDYSEYYVDPTAAEPVGNETLTFEVIYQKVLRNYYLLYPAMSRVILLNDRETWLQPNIVQSVLNRTDKIKVWDQYHYMPRTRDLSASRRQLLRAWCYKVLAAQGGN